MEQSREIDYNYSPSPHATEPKRDANFQKYLENGLSIYTNKVNEFFTPLQTALHLDDIEMVRFLLEHNVDPNQCFLPGEWEGCSPLHFVLTLRSSAMAILLIEYGAKIFSMSHDKVPTIYFAIKFNRVRVIHYLLDRGLSPDTLITDHFSLLTYAVIEGNINLVECVLEHKPNVNLYQHKQVIVQAVYAHINCSKKLVKILYEYGFTLQPADITPDLVITAVNGDHYEVVQNLLSLNVNPNLEIMPKIRSKGTMLHFAVKADKSKIVRLLLKYGANVHHRDYSGRTPILIAARRNNLYVIKLLLQYGASVMDVDSYNCSVLHYAIMEQADWLKNYLNWHVNNTKTAIVELFISKGADINIKTNNTRSYPLHFAAQVGVPGVVHALLAHGARVNEANTTNNTPLELIEKQIVNLNIRINNNNNNLESDIPHIFFTLKLVTFRLLQHHVYQLDRIGLPVGWKDLTEYNDDIIKLNDDFKKAIDNEIKFIKGTKIGNSYITLYRFLTSTDDDAAELVRNNDILENLETMLLLPRQFPEYAQLIRHKLVVALAKKDLNKVVFKVMNFFFKEKKLSVLPDECTEHIVRFFTEEDKKILVSQFVK